MITDSAVSFFKNTSLVPVGDGRWRLHRRIPTTDGWRPRCQAVIESSSSRRKLEVREGKSTE